MLLFVIVMEALNAMFAKADERHLLSPLNLKAVPFRVSLYADRGRRHGLPAANVREC
jgi:hypothetical protein